MRILFIVLFMSLAPIKESKAAFGLTQDHPILKFCDAATKIGLILSQYPMPHLWPSVQVLPFPPFIAPGIVAGFASRTAVVIELCNLMYDIEALGTQGAIYATGRYLNNLTDNKWSHHLDMADQTWNLANTFYDFESGEKRKGTLQSASTHREINDYMKSSYGWYNKTFNDSDAQMKNRGEREQELNQFASLVSRRAILAEATTCPDASNNPNYEKIYKNEIQPWEKKKDLSNDDVIFFQGKILEMAPKFVNDQKELESFTSELENLMTQGVNYKVATQTKKEVTKKPHPSKKDKEGHVVMVDASISKKTQIWSAMMFPDMFEDFRKKWGPKWQSWVTAQYVQSSQGLLNNPRERVEKEFRDLSYECNSNRLMRGVDTERADYEKIRDERVEKCYAETPVNQKKAENMLNYYISQLQLSLKNLKDANAQIWTKESQYLGLSRAVTTTTGKGANDAYQQEQVACSESQEMSMATMEKLSLKQKQVTTELKQVISKQYTKKTVMKEESRKASAAETEESNKRIGFAEQQKKSSDSNLRKNNVSPMAKEGGM